MMIFCDTHDHLYLDEFRPDAGKVLERAAAAGVRHILLPNIDRTSIQPMLEMISSSVVRNSEFGIQDPASCILHPVSLYPMIGLHPTSVKADFREELDIMEEYLDAPEYCFRAVGEIGIDLYWDQTFRAQQEEAFSRQLDLAIRHNLPVAVHTRNSFDLAAGIIESKQNPGLKGVFHCFGGNIAQARRAVSLGFLLGIGGVITYKNSGLQQVVKAIGAEHLLLETDAPFLPPVPHRGERNEPSYLPLIAEKIAEILHIPAEEVAARTTENTFQLFDLIP